MQLSSKQSDHQINWIACFLNLSLKEFIMQTQMTSNISKELILYTHPMSRGRTVRWMLEEIGQPYQTEILEYGTTMKSPEYLEINPMGQVPALRHGHTIVTEAAAICAYLADAFPAAKLAPVFNDPKRGTYYRWLFFMASSFDAAFTNKHLGLIIPKDKEVMIGYGNIDDVLNTLEYAVSQGDYLLGDSFSAADIYTGAYINWALYTGEIEHRDAFERYVTRLNQRPAKIRADKIDDELLAASTKS